jgi:GT2 family glycosyltransferase
MEKHMDVSVIIVNYNTIKFLINAIDSVFEKTRDIEFEIIVVDNNSSDNSKNIIQEKYGDKVTYLALPENIGFGRANNAAAEIAKGRNLFFLNPDTLLINNAIKILSNYLDNHEKAAVCGGNLYDEKYEPVCSFGRLYNSILYELNHLFLGFPEKIIYGKNIIFNYTDNPLNVAFVIGADMMIKKDIFFKLKGFDKDFFMFHEEIELAYRIHKLKYKIMNVPDACIVHFEGKSISSNEERLEKKMMAQKLYLHKTHNRMALFVVNSIFFINAVLRFMGFSILKNTEKMKFWSFILKKAFIITPPPPPPLIFDQRYLTCACHPAKIMEAA